MPEVSSPANAAARTVPARRTPSSPPVRPGAFQLIFGTLLPLTTLTIEILTHQCAEAFFDPIPTWWHVLLVALVPVSNLGVWIAAHRDEPVRGRALAHLNALAIGVALAYTLVFIPIVPFAIVALVFMGWGMLPLTPAFSLIAAIGARRALRAMPGDPPPSVWPGLAVGLALLALPVAHREATNYLLERALSPQPEEQRAAVRWLRYLAREDHLLEACYGRSGAWLMPMFNPVSFDGQREKVQQVFYRVTGETYNSRPAPVAVTVGRRPGRGSWNFDLGIGGTQVADKAAGLSMASSRMEGRVETAAGTSYVEWTMVFKNVARNQSEARAQIELPPGGAVSRLTLWIDGEPREAAFGGRNQVRAAYQEIAVAQRRDPVLVTTSGPDRVLMQCFPVPPNGGEMKVRLGITAPLRLLDERDARVILPRLLETNFAQPREVQHEAVWTGDRPLSERGKAWLDKVDLKLRDDELRARVALRTERASLGDVWTDDPLDPAMVIRQTVRRVTVEAPRRIVFVIDGSRAVGAPLKEIARAIEKLPPTQDFAIYYAGDEVETPPGKMVPPAAARWLRDRGPIGGRDNLPALLRAWDDAAAVPGSAIVWIHGPQPVLLAEIDPLLTRFEQAKTPPAFHDLAVAAGPNRLLEQAANFRGVKAVNFGGTPVEDLQHLIALWIGTSAEYLAERTREPRAEPLTAEAKSDRHVARLWGLEEIERLRATAEPGSLDKAIKLALALQLVTPVSGAVVLETQQQYDRHNLKPVPPDSVPTVPEPSAVLWLIGGAVLWFTTRRPRRVAIHAL
jgi:hypothetical protein